MNTRSHKSCLLAGMLSLTALLAEAATPASVTIINISDKPVYATAVALPADAAAAAAAVEGGVPLELVGSDGASTPLFRYQSHGAAELRAVLDFEPGERMDFTLRKAKAWGDPGASASFDAATGTARISNGVLTLEYADGKWSLAYSSDPSQAICRNGQLDYWLADVRHGRLMGMSDETLRGMNLLRSTESATLEGGKALVNPDGSATLVLQKRFPGIGENVVWEESYTLNAAEPVLIYKNRWACTDERTRYITYVHLGAALIGDYGPLIQGKLRFKYDIPASGSERSASGISVANTTNTSTEGPRILLSGNNNSFTRISWRNERCWVGVDSELGNGIAFSTLESADDRFIPGNTIWNFSNTGFFVRLLDSVQENQPYAFSREEPLELGFAIAATNAGVGIWNQGRKLFQAVTNDETPSIGDACAVFLNSRPIKAGEASRIDAMGADAAVFVEDDGTLRADLETDFKRPYQLTAKVSGATAEDPVTVRVTSDEGESFVLMTIDESGEETIDFTSATGWLESRRTYTMEIAQGTKAKLESLVLEPAPFGAPELHAPADKLDLTDIAAYFRWFQVRGAIDYEIQLDRSPTFSAPITLTVRSEADKPHYMPADFELPAPGLWHWRVRALEATGPGQWSEPWAFSINNDIEKKPLLFKPTPEHPLFTMEGCRVPDWSRFKDTIPSDIKPYVAIQTNIYNTDDHIGYLRAIRDEMKMRAFVRTHGPGPMSYWMPLSVVEEIFQTYPNVIGIMGGETLSALYRGGEMEVYMQRLLQLCGKYGRIFYEADGSYPSENKYQALYEKKSEMLKDYSDYIVFAQKNNILHRQFVTQSSVLGLYLAGDIVAQGAWEDGGWYWQQTGFRNLGEIMGQRGGDVTTMPRIFWTLNYLMGLGRGCSVFSFEGQVGTTPVPEGWNYAKDGWPEITDAAYRNPAAFWTTDGELTDTFKRFSLPFMRAVINHRLVPTKEELLQNIELAVYNDGIPKKDDGDQYYYEWEALYRGTYGFRDIGVHPGTLMEFFPNTGRYHYFPVLPQGKRDLGPEIEVLSLSGLMETEEVERVFNAAYPEWYSGDALVSIVGDTLTVLNSNENLDETQTYSVPLPERGGFTALSGKIGPHAYVLGKFDDSNQRLWLQANTEYPERDTELTLTLKSVPKVTVTPASAAKVNAWDADTRTLSLVLSHADGAVEVTIAE